MGYIGEMLDEQSIFDFADFEAFYAWFDALTHHEQEDSGEVIEGHKGLLEIAYSALQEEAGLVQGEAPSCPGL